MVIEEDRAASLAVVGGGGYWIAGESGYISRSVAGIRNPVLIASLIIQLILIN